MRVDDMLLRIPLALIACLCVPVAATAHAQAPPLQAERTRDTTVKPGDDFFAYANRAWLSSAVIPPGRDRWGVRDDIDVKTARQIAALLNDARTARPGSLARQVADFHAALLDRDAIDAKGLSAVAPMLERIAALHDKRALTRFLGATMRADVDPLNIGIFASRSILGLSVEHSIHGEHTYTAFLVQGGLGLGDRDRYVATDSAGEARRARYRTYVAHALTLAGFDHPDRRADSVVALETAIAVSHATLPASAVDRNADNEWSRSEFARQAPGFDWDVFFDAAGLGKQRVIVAWQPTAVKGVAALVASRPLDTWKDYLRFHAIDDVADALPRAISDAAADLRGDRRTRDERALAMTADALSGAVGKLYAERYFSPRQKARVRDIVGNVTAAFRRHVANVPWLSPDSRRIALEKIDALYVGIGYPETWERWTDLRVDPKDAAGNLRRVAERSRRHALMRLGSAYDSHEWVLGPHLVSAVLLFQQNAYTFAAALLQPPKFDSTASDAAAYGAIGALIGHDVSHFVDVLGADYLPDGRMHRWWTAADSANFETAAGPLVRQFSAYEPLPGVHVNGRLTRTENVADLAGLTAAFEAYRQSLGAKRADTAYVRRADREFFIAFARSFGVTMNDRALRAQLATDHAPETYRMNTVRNLDAWYDAFGVGPGQRLYIEPGARVRVW